MFFQKLQIDVLDGLNHTMGICISICWLEQGSEWLWLDICLGVQLKQEEMYSSIGFNYMHTHYLLCL